MAEWVFATLEFWKRTADRVIIASTSSFLGLLMGSQTTLFDMEWIPALAVTATSAVVAFCHSVLAERTALPLTLETPTDERQHR